MASNQPNATLYVNNLNDKVNTKELRSQLFALFTTYGKVIDIVTSKGHARRGQAFLVFTDLAGATSAMRACEGMVFYDKPLVSPFTQRQILPVIFKPQPITTST
jgi:U2 small nuclear ribonucleoprotein B''